MGDLGPGDAVDVSDVDIDGDDTIGTADGASAVEHDVEELVAEVERFKDMAMRVQADFENFRKRAAQQTAEEIDRATGRMAEAFLPIIDAAEAAYVGSPDEVGPLLNALGQVVGINTAIASRSGGAEGIGFAIPVNMARDVMNKLIADGEVRRGYLGIMPKDLDRDLADAFGVDAASVAVTSTRTDKVPNTSPTAASSGTDLNGMAAKIACESIRERMTEYARAAYKVGSDEISFADGRIQIGSVDKSFAEFATECWLNRVQLSATGFYKTPKIHYDRESGTGRPFFYYANGAAVSEVVVDIHTGEYRLCAVDILQDVGESVNPAIDIGQIEGGFVQGLGWLTTEELKWSAAGRLLSDSPANYKIPAVADIPERFNVQLLKDSPNREATVYHSKAVGEPPFMLAISAWCAIRDAVSSISDYRLSPRLDAPATCEKVLFAIKDLQSRSA